jgi:competence ComEA-like helix-hairpin-helix protein
VQLPVDIEIPEHLHITVRGLIAGLPDELFVCPKVDLGQRTDLEMTVEVPVEPMLPQLQKGRITLPLGNVIDLLPRAILCQPLPDTDVANVPLPLHEIVAQLPPELFTAQLSSTRPDEFEAVETEIPMPFQERAPRVTVRPPAPPVAPPVEEAPEEVSVEDLEHEEIPIFAEKQPATAPVAPAAPPAPEPLPEPVAPPPVVEEVVPVAAAAEPILPMEEPPAPPTPVVEPVVPALVAEEDAGVIDEKKFLIDLNRCSVEDLVRIPGVGRTLAQRVIDFRNNRGQFTSLDQLRLIPGIGRKTFRALTGAEPRSLNRLLGVDDARELTLQEIVKLTNSLPGIEGSMLAMSDGLFVAGQLPAELDQEAISVFAPQLFKRVGRYVKELKVGHVRRFTIFTELRPISIFHAGDVYLVIIHDTRHFSKKLLRQCERISQEIARLCRQRTIV